MARVRVKIKDIPPKETEAVEVPVTEEVVTQTEPSDSSEVLSSSELSQLSSSSSESPPPSQPSVFHSDGIVVSRRQLIIIGIIAAALITVGIVLVTRDNANSENSQTAETSQSALPNPQSEATHYHQEISKYVELPQDQVPQLVAVSDPSKLAERLPALFKSTQKDDVVLFYVNPDKTTKAVLYRPSTEKVITVVDGVTPGDGNSSSQNPSSTQTR